MTGLSPKRLQKGVYFIFAAAIFVLLISCGDKNDDSRSDKKPPADSLVVEIKGSSGLSVLEVTITAHELDMINSGQGVFIRAIDGVKAGNGFSWIYSVNDSLAGISADRYITNDGDVVKWHYRRF